ncbi:MAG: hypothetical protein QOE03_1230 [Micromonosporaceae bacterium]|nr:hypothetical protein [Micromonosporaceae bacterium]
MADPDYVDDLDDLGVGLSPARGLPRRAEITGEVVKIEDAYPRRVAVGAALAVAVLAGVAVTRVLAALLAMVLGAKAGAGDGRGLWTLRKGPEFRVTPIWIRDTDGFFVEVEVHGYLSGRALRPNDLVRVAARRQDGRRLPMRAHRIDNLTIGRFVTPRRPTVWTHLWPGPVIQAVIGMAILAAVAGALWVGR